MNNQVVNRIRRPNKALDEVHNHLVGFLDEARNAHPLVQFIVALCAIDAVASYWCGCKSVECAGAVFRSFVDCCLPRYKGKFVYNELRCSLVHNFVLGNKIVLINDHADCHLKYYDRKKKNLIVEGVVSELTPLVLNCNDFVHDVRCAIQDVMTDARIGVAAPMIVLINDAYRYVFKGQTAQVVLLKKSDYEQIDNRGNDLEYAKWVVKNIEMYKSISGKYNFIRKALQRQEEKRKLIDNICAVADDIAPPVVLSLAGETEIKSDDGLTLFTRSDALTGEMIP